LNYLDNSGEWRESEDLIELMPDGGAAALRCPNKVLFSPTLSANAGIKIVTKSNLVFTAYPLAVLFYDPSTGKRQLLATFKDGVKGQFVPPNRMIYPSAFHSALLDADLRITVTRGAIEWDTIVTRPLPATVTPQTYSMNPSTTLFQVQHAWTTPFPPKLGQITVSGMDDTSIDFGDLQFAPGRSFAWDGSAPDTNTPARITVMGGNDHPVAKSWQNGSPSVLSESVLWTNVQGLPAFVIDPVIVGGSGDYTFNTYSQVSHNTYWLQSSATFGGTVTFNSGCVIKRAPGATLTVSGAIVCNGTGLAPSIITSQDDKMYGEQVSSGCAVPDNAVALVTMVRAANVTGMNIRFAGWGIEFYGECCTDNRLFKDSSIESCTNGVYAFAANATIQNSAISCVKFPSLTANNGTVTGTWGSTYHQISLHEAAVAAMQSLTNSTKTTDLYNRDVNGYAVSYNPNCWMLGVKGLTSITVSNGVPAGNCGYTNINNPIWYSGGSCIITPQHAL
jgi:hypothetical protein